MAVEFEKLKFTRDWNNSSDFPTYEENEQKVRADMQALHDETKEFINETLIPSIENMAVPGTGDMKAEVYDPWNKRKDVYQYADEKAAETVAETMEEHLTQAHHVDAFSKEETLSAETRETFGLAEDATPNDAFSKIASTPDVVMDSNTGKKYTVKSGVKGWPQQKKWALAPQFGTKDKVGLSRFYRYNDTLLAASTTKVNSNYPLTVEYQTLNGEPVKSVSNNSAESQITYFDNMQRLSVDNALFTLFNLTGTRVYDLKEPGTFMHLESSSTYAVGVWNTENKWGYLKEQSNTQRSLVIYDRGTTTPASSVSLGSRSGGIGSTNLTALDGDFVYILQTDNDNMYSLGRVNLVEKTFASKLYIYDFTPIKLPNYGIVSVYNVITDGVYAYFALSQRTGSGTSFQYHKCDRILKINFRTGESNLSDFTTDDFVQVSSGYDVSPVNTESYIGTIGTTAYFWRGTTVYQLEKDTCELSFYDVEIARPADAKHKNITEVVFDIEGLPNVIICDTWLIDVSEGSVSAVRGIEKTSATDTGAPTFTQTFSRYGVTFGGLRVTDCEMLGAYDGSTLIGGKPVVTVEALEEFAE